ncbi:MAG: hypothetical protein R6V00_08470 [Candidatus Aminicenantes bacterium]
MVCNLNHMKSRKQHNSGVKLGIPHFPDVRNQNQCRRELREDGYSRMFRTLVTFLSAVRQCGYNDSGRCGTEEGFDIWKTCSQREGR